MTRQKEQETLQKNKRADGNGKSNDSPEVPAKGKKTDISGLPSGLIN